jgi:hypothetical protein
MPKMPVGIVAKGRWDVSLKILLRLYQWNSSLQWYWQLQGHGDARYGRDCDDCGDAVPLIAYPKPVCVTGKILMIAQTLSCVICHIVTLLNKIRSLNLFVSVAWAIALQQWTPQRFDGTKIQPTKGIWSNGLNRANNDRIISRFEL